MSQRMIFNNRYNYIHYNTYINDEFKINDELIEDNDDITEENDELAEDYLENLEHENKENKNNNPFDVFSNSSGPISSNPISLNAIQPNENVQNFVSLLLSNLHGSLNNLLNDSLNNVDFKNNNLEQTKKFIEKRTSICKEDEKCTICFETMKDVKIVETSCKHKFCYTCLFEWIKKKDNCPLCRKKLD